MEEILKLSHIYKSYPDLCVFQDLNIDFLKNQINCVLGPSGCGKTTLLNIINRTIPPDSGDISDFSSKRISYVFQDPRLLPWKTVEENIAFVLKERMNREDWEKRTDHILDLVQLKRFRHYYPSQISGGMKQRASLARAFTYPSDVILMDEPFKALDLKLKKNLTDQFISLWKSDKRTVIFVTHDPEEAVKLGKKISIFSNAPVKIIREFINHDSANKEGILREIIKIIESIEN